MISKTNINLIKKGFQVKPKKNEEVTDKYIDDLSQDQRIALFEACSIALGLLSLGKEVEEDVGEPS